MYKIKSDLSAHACKLHILEDEGRVTRQVSGTSITDVAMPTVDSTVRSPENSQAGVGRSLVVATEGVTAASLAGGTAAPCSDTVTSTATQPAIDSPTTAAVLTIPDLSFIRHSTRLANMATANTNNKPTLDIPPPVKEDES